MQKSVKEEIKTLERHLEENPDSICFARLADAYLQSSRLDEAIELCERGVRIHSDYLTGHFILGKCYIHKKLFDQAEKELKKVIARDPKYIAAHREYGELMAQIGWTSACESSFNHILLVDPFNNQVKNRFEQLKAQFSPPTETPQQEEHSNDYDLKDIPENIFSDEVEKDEKQVPKNDKPGFDDLELKQPDFPDESTLLDTNELANDDNEIGILEDIFRDTSISDLETGAVTPPLDAAETAFEKETENIEQDFLKEQDVINDQDFTKESDVTKDQEFPPQHQPEIIPELPSDTDPFYELSKEGLQEEESEITEQNIFGIPQVPEIDKPSIESTFEPESIPEPEPMPFPTIPEAQTSSDTEKQEEEKPPSKKEKIVTPTLGEIYFAQHQYSKAISVYELLLKKDPNNKLYNQKIAMLKRKIEEEENN